MKRHLTHPKAILPLVWGLSIAGKDIKFELKKFTLYGSVRYGGARGLRFIV